MENKYYTPKIEDFHVGFECEIQSSYGWQKDTWPKVLTLDSLTFQTLIDEGVVKATKKAGLRVAYLTTEQIEAEGWTLQPTNQTGKYFRKGDLFMSFYKIRTDDNLQHKLLIYRIHDPEIESSEESTVPTEMLYNGTYKSINEFRILMKFLEI